MTTITENYPPGYWRAEQEQNLNPNVSQIQDKIADKKEELVREGYTEKNGVYEKNVGGNITRVTIGSDGTITTETLTQQTSKSSPDTSLSRKYNSLVRDLADAQRQNAPEYVQRQLRNQIKVVEAQLKNESSIILEGAPTSVSTTTDTDTLTNLGYGTSSSLFQPKEQDLYLSIQSVPYKDHLSSQVYVKEGTEFKPTAYRVSTETTDRILGKEQPKEVATAPPSYVKATSEVFGETPIYDYQKQSLVDFNPNVQYERYAGIVAYGIYEGGKFVSNILSETGEGIMRTGASALPFNVKVGAGTFEEGGKEQTKDLLPSANVKDVVYTGLVAVSSVKLLGSAVVGTISTIGLYTEAKNVISNPEPYNVAGSVGRASIYALGGREILSKAIPTKRTIEFPQETGESAIVTTYSYELGSKSFIVGATKPSEGVKVSTFYKSPDVSTKLVNLKITGIKGEGIRISNPTETKVIQIGLTRLNPNVFESPSRAVEFIPTAQKILSSTYSTKSSFINEFSSGTEALTPEGVKIALEVAREEGGLVSGSFSRSAQLSKKYTYKDISTGEVYYGTEGNVRSINIIGQERTLKEIKFKVEKGDYGNINLEPKFESGDYVKLYHGTTTEAYNLIILEGLKQGKKSRGFKDYEEPFISTTLDKNVARAYAGDNGKIIEIYVPKEKFKSSWETLEIAQDPYSMGTGERNIVFVNDIPKEWLVKPQTKTKSRLFDTTDSINQEYELSKVPGDIDIHLKGTPEEIQLVAESTLLKFKEAGFDAKLKGQGGVVQNAILVKQSSGEYVKGIEFLGEGTTPLDQVPPDMVIGFTKSGKPIEISGVKSTSLTEELRGTTQGIARLRRLESGKLDIYPREGRVKDIGSVSVSARTLQQSKTFGKAELQKNIEKFESLYPADLVKSQVTKVLNEPEQVLIADYSKVSKNELVKPSQLVASSQKSSEVKSVSPSLSISPSTSISPSVRLSTSVSPSPSTKPSPSKVPSPSPSTKPSPSKVPSPSLTTSTSQISSPSPSVKSPKINSPSTSINKLPSGSPPTEKKSLPLVFPSSKNESRNILEVRKEGKFKAVDIGDVESLKERGIDILKGTARASFRIKSERGETLDVGIPKGFIKSKKEKGVVVQPRESRISSRGEKEEITMKGLRTLRSKKGFNFGG
jgi:hypothetical protein